MRQCLGFKSVLPDALVRSVSKGPGPVRSVPHPTAAPASTRPSARIVHAYRRAGFDEKRIDALIPLAMGQDVRLRRVRRVGCRLPLAEESDRVRIDRRRPDLRHCGLAGADHDDPPLHLRAHGTQIVFKTFNAGFLRGVDKHDLRRDRPMRARRPRSYAKRQRLFGRRKELPLRPDGPPARMPEDPGFEMGVAHPPGTQLFDRPLGCVRGGGRAGQAGPVDVSQNVDDCGDLYRSFFFRPNSGLSVPLVPICRVSALRHLTYRYQD